MESIPYSTETDPESNQKKGKFQKINLFFIRIDNGRRPGKNTYSSWPIYLCKEKSSNFHMSYLRNINAMDFLLKPNSKDKTKHQI